MTDHLQIRLRDGSLHTSHSLDYIHYAFDIMLNEEMSHNSSELIFKRGFEHLTDQGITGVEKDESAIEYNEFDSSRKVKELAALMKHKPWDFFYTFTASDRTSPGLCITNQVFKTAFHDTATDDIINDPDTHENMLPLYHDYECNHSMHQNFFEQNIMIVSRC